MPRYTIQVPFKSNFVVPSLLLAAGFTAAQIIQALHQGQFSVPVTYDDNAYLLDAAQRVQLMYDQGFAHLLADLFSNPPHSPLSTLNGIVGLTFIGWSPWSVALINFFYLAGGLLLLGRLMRDLSVWAFIAAALALLAWPLSAFLVVETRPDVVCGILTALGIICMYSSSWPAADRYRVVGVSLAFGLALLAKPSISPITGALYGLSIFIASMVESRDRDKSRWRRLIGHNNLLSFGIVAAIALPYYAVAWRGVLDYIYTTTFGEEKAIWALVLTPREHLLYYLTGPGAQAMMGPWLWLTLVASVIGYCLARLSGTVLPWQRLLGFGATALAAYALVSFPTHKSIYLGILVPCLLLVSFAHVIAFSFAVLSKTSKPRVGTVTYGLVLLIAAVSLHQWHWFYRSPGFPAVESAEISARRFRLLGEITDLISRQGFASTRVFFASVTPYLNPGTLGFEFAKRRIPNVMTYDFHRTNDLAQYQQALAEADVVVSFATDYRELLAWLPSTERVAWVNEAIDADAGWQVKTLAGPLGDDAAIRIALRRDLFSDVIGDARLDLVEGPYPQLGLPRVRWGLGQGFSLRPAVPVSPDAVLRMVGEAPMTGQVMSVSVDHSEVKECHFPEPGLLVVCEVSLAQYRSGQEIRVAFKRWTVPSTLAPRPLSVLFHELTIVDSKLSSQDQG